jgi:hypothetical protein
VPEYPLICRIAILCIWYPMKIPPAISLDDWAACHVLLLVAAISCMNDVLSRPRTAPTQPISRPTHLGRLESRANKFAVKSTDQKLVRVAISFSKKKSEMQLKLPTLGQSVRVSGCACLTLGSCNMHWRGVRI